jgi:hypothetical protein
MERLKRRRLPQQPPSLAIAAFSPSARRLETAPLYFLFGRPRPDLC